jgi:acyl-coenzyme A synthetase/AMP-(fatty) acid ligase
VTGFCPEDVKGLMITDIDSQKLVKQMVISPLFPGEEAEAIKAVVALAPGRSATEEQLISFCKKHIASYKKPRAVDFVDELPKNNYGKILKRELRANYWKKKDRKV